MLPGPVKTPSDGGLVQAFGRMWPELATDRRHWNLCVRTFVAPRLPPMLAPTHGNLAAIGIRGPPSDGRVAFPKHWLFGLSIGYA